MTQSAQSTPPESTASTGETEIHALYAALLDAWNRRDAVAMAALFAEDGHVVGFDGSVLDGKDVFEEEMSRIFKNHQTAAYVGKVREVIFLAPDVVLLRAVSGMVPPGQKDLNPAVNTIQSLVARKVRGKASGTMAGDATHWRIALYQNTPAQFHGRPDLVQQLTDELRKLL